MRILLTDVQSVYSTMCLQVMNLGDSRSGLTISVNHNWLNAHCVSRVWDLLRNELALARGAIAHERVNMGEIDWTRHCTLGTTQIRVS